MRPIYFPSGGNPNSYFTIVPYTKGVLDKASSHVTILSCIGFFWINPFGYCWSFIEQGVYLSLESNWKLYSSNHACFDLCINMVDMSSSII